MDYLDFKYAQKADMQVSTLGVTGTMALTVPTLNEGTRLKGFKLKQRNESERK